MAHGDRLPARFSLSLATHVGLLFGIALLPLLIFAGYQFLYLAKAEQAHLEHMAHVDARNVAALIERHLEGDGAMVQALALAPELRTGDLRAFHMRAREFLALQGGNVVLRDLSGQQLVNTRVPWGMPLPKGADIHGTDVEAIAGSGPKVTNVFTGAVKSTPLYIVEVPIRRNGRVAYLLGLSLPLSRIRDLLAAVLIEEGRWITIIDGNGIVLARSFNHDAVAGQPVLPPAQDAIAAANPDSSVTMISPEGIRNFAAFHRVADSPWVAAVAVREDVLLAPLRQSLHRTAGFAAVSLVSSLTIGLAYRRFLQRGTLRLMRLSSKLGKQVPDIEPGCGVRELDQVGQVLVEAGRELHLQADSQEKLLAALGKAPVIVRDLDGRIVFWGEGAQALYGYSRAEAGGRLSHDLLRSEFPQPIERIKEVLAGVGQWKGVVRQRSKNGTPLVIESNWALWRNAFTQQPAAVVETNVDMTASIARAVAEEESSAKTAFMGQISHDLRQPLQAARLFQQVLEGQVEGASHAVVERMGLALGSAEEMLSAMSELSVLDAGKLAAKPSRFCVGDVLREVTDDCAPIAAAANLRLRCVWTGEMVETDRVLFKRMVRNLAVNAIRYTRRGGVLIGCRHDAGKLLVHVLDSGIGIPAAQLAHIFDAFYQVGDAPQNGGRGLGLGLAIVSRLSHLLQLPVTVTSLRDRGSDFRIQL